MNCSWPQNTHIHRHALEVDDVLSYVGKRAGQDKKNRKKTEILMVKNEEERSSVLPPFRLLAVLTVRVIWKST